MNNPYVSVCIVTYNQQQYIRDCLVSVVTQELGEDFEILVGDDGSTDSTCEVIESVIKEFPGKIKLFRHPQNLGPTGNYQFLIEKAQGEFIAHLDGDDYWLPGKLQSQVDFLCHRPQCVAVYSNAVVINDKNEIFGIFNNPIPVIFDLNFLLSEGNFLNHSSMLYCARVKNEILAIEGPFIDYRIHLRFARQGQLGFTNQAHVIYRVGSATSMISNQHEKVRKLYLAALMEIPDDEKSFSAKRSSLAQFYLGELYLLIRRGHFLSGLRLLRIINSSAPKGTVICILSSFGEMPM